VHPYSSVLTHALGVPDEERIDTLLGEIQEGDLYLLCTDGLTTVLDDDTIEDILVAGVDLVGRANDLIEAANGGGGPDNITVVLIRATEVG
jgi:PPM family protein phosphatase